MVDEHGRNLAEQKNGVTTNATKQLEEYFLGHRREFSLRLEIKGTLFQSRVWQALRSIPYGETASYQEMAAKIDNPKAQRAVGMANNKNPLPIIIPCHRVVGKNGDLVGYGLGLKKNNFCWI